MVISNLNTKLIEDRLGFILKAHQKLIELSKLEREEFLTNDKPAIAESYLRRALESVFDIGRHILAKIAGKGVVEYKEIAKKLGEHGVISKPCAEKLILMAGYRNRLVHFYHDVSDEELYTIIRENLSDIEQFIREMKNFIKSYKNAIL
ncbi:hypothetical protein THER_1674 [Thermodesulfovibrio sp. N1]|uniref:type VII toxin-antitoxin system HepT family RNase toxin n=1 Tax=Thermodesulfovibrio sp. N1 TaxID=1871110 RepID=UPI00083ACE78|nr:DUF86 domain-containing protein [Thermodesulfovibrio sp. N1]ODA43601.1 hypothetical protein THER_1674 [Thermodesulfovibrio sp. N1]